MIFYPRNAFRITIDFRYFAVEYNTILDTIRKKSLNFVLTSHKRRLYLRRAIGVFFESFREMIPRDIESVLSTQHRMVQAHCWDGTVLGLE